MKKKVLQSCAKAWRDFKNKLVRQYIKKDAEDKQLGEEDDQEQHRNPPYVIYNYISEQDWKEFERRCTSSPFKVCLLFFYIFLSFYMFVHICAYLFIFVHIWAFLRIFEYFNVSLFHLLLIESPLFL